MFGNNSAEKNENINNVIDSKEELNQDLETLANESKESIRNAEKTAQALLEKIKNTTKENNIQLPQRTADNIEANINNYYQQVFNAAEVFNNSYQKNDRYSEKINNLKTKQESLDPNSDKYQNLSERINSLETKQNEERELAHQQYQEIITQAELSKNVLLETSKLLLKPELKINPEVEALMDSMEEEEVEEPMPFEIKKKETPIIIDIPEEEEVEEAMPEVVQEYIQNKEITESLSPTLKQYRENGINFIQANQELLKELGVTTLDTSNGGNVTKGGLQAIAEMQAILKINNDGILGPITNKIIDNYLNSKIYTKPETKEQSVQLDEATVEAPVLKLPESGYQNTVIEKTTEKYSEGEMNYPIFKISETGNQNVPNLSYFIKENTLYYLKDGAPKVSTYYNLENNTITPKRIIKQRKEELISSDKGFDLDQEDWEDIQNVEKSDWENLLKLKKENPNLSSFRFYDKYRTQLGTLGDIGPYDLDHMIDWMKGTDGQKFLTGTEKTLKQYVDKISK